MTIISVATGDRSTPFEGFEPLTANFIYCPNQFFDVCLPHYSRGVVRLVGYILYRTLRWRDQDGNPCEENIPVPYADLVSEAGISRRAFICKGLPSPKKMMWKPCFGRKVEIVRIISTRT